MTDSARRARGSSAIGSAPSIPPPLSPDNQLDREQLLHAIDSRLLTLDVVRPWAKDADSYSSGLTNTAYVMIKRQFAPPEERLRKLIAREKAMPAALPRRARTSRTRRGSTRRSPSIRSTATARSSRPRCPAPSPTSRTRRCSTSSRQTNDAVIAALADYKKWLQDDLLKRSNGEFAFGEDTYRKKLAADEMIDVPLDELLAIADRDLKKNQAAFAETAQRIDPKQTPRAGARRRSRPIIRRPRSCSSITQAGARRDRPLHDRPPHRHRSAGGAGAGAGDAAVPARDDDRRRWTFPGPFEKVATEAYYNMTLPDPKWSGAGDRRVHEAVVLRGDLQRLGARGLAGALPAVSLRAQAFPSDVRKVFGAATNSEGWAHYCEQMVIDEGFHADDPRYRLAQIQDALLRDARFIVGIRMHTKGMTVRAGGGVLRQGGVSARARRAIREPSAAPPTRPTATTRWAS